LSERLRNALETWAEKAWKVEDAALDAEGRKLMDEAQRVLGNEYLIIWDDN
jgi:hypothetical protein